MVSSDTTINSTVGGVTIQRAPLQGLRLAAVWTVWGGLLLAILWAFLSALSGRMAQQLAVVTATQGAAVTYDMLLRSVGLSPKFFVFYTLMPEAVLMVVFVLLGIVIFARRSQDWVSIFMSLALILLGVVLTPTLWFVAREGPASSNMHLSPLMWRLDLLVYSLGLGFEVWFFYLFPDGVFTPPWTKRLAIFWSVACLAWACLPDYFFAYPVLTYAFVMLIFIGGYGSGVAAQIYRYRHASVQQRRQTRWVVLGAGVSVMLMMETILVQPFLDQFLTQYTTMGLFFKLIGTPIMAYMPAGLLLVSLGIAGMRYRLWDLDLLINRSLVYVTVTIVLGSFYLGLLFLLAVLLRQMLNLEDNTLAVFVATLTIALAFNPLRQRTQMLIDRAFYRNRVDYQQVVPALGARVATTIVPERLAELLIVDVPQQLQICWAALAVLDSDGAQLNWQQDGVERPPLGLDHPLVRYAQYRTQPIVSAYMPIDLPLEAENFLKVHQIALCLPLTIGGMLVGLYCLGPLLYQRSYTRREVELLHFLGQQAAASVENARLYRQVEAYSRNLEREVRARTGELERAYEDLAEEHARLDVILQNVADGLVVTDLQDRVTRVNPIFTQLVNRPEAIMVGKRLEEVLPEAALAQVVMEAQSQESAVATADIMWGSRVYRASACALRSGTGASSGAVTVLRDITQEVEMARMKDDFVSMVSHELRTPMTSVLGFAHLIQKQFNRNIRPRLPQDDEKSAVACQRIDENLAIIISEGDRLTRLINDVLDLAKMESGRLEWEMASLKLEDALESSLAGVHSLALERKLKLRMDVHDSLPELYGDRDRLVQVVTNLLSNALKFTDEGEVTVAARLLAPGEAPNIFGACAGAVVASTPVAEPSVWVSVTDTGVGIAPEDLGKVFERFRQVGNRSQGTRRSGTGLGLSICREIVEHHGGRIWVESQVGVGSRFSFTVPVTVPGTEVPDGV